MHVHQSVHVHTLIERRVQGGKNIFFRAFGKNCTSFSTSANSIGIGDKAFGGRFGYFPGYIVGNLDIKYIANSSTCSIKGRYVVGHFPLA
jgi:hypothetical protein